MLNPSVFYKYFYVCCIPVSTILLKEKYNGTESPF
jgi:hypothetical protein